MNSRLFFLPVLFFSSLINYGIAQVPDIVWQKTFGGPGNDVLQDIYPTSDGNFIMLGLADANGGDVACTIRGKHDSWIIKMAPDSTILWQKCYGGSLEEGNPNSKIIQTSDGGYLFQTESWSDDFDVTGHHAYSDAWTVKLDANGDKVWAKSFGGTKYDVPRFLMELPGNKYLALSRTTSQNGDVPVNDDPELFDAWVFVFDNDGNIIQNKIYGGTGDDDLYKAILLPNGNIAMFGFTNSSDGDLAGLDVDGVDGWMLVIDAVGNVVSSKVYGQGNEEDILDALATDDGGFLVFGDTEDPTIPVDKGSYHGDFDFWAMKLDASGNMQWQGVYGGTKREQFHRASKSPGDDGYFLTGSTLSIDGDIINEDNKLREYCLVHIDGSGNLLWSTAVGGSEQEYCYAVVESGILVGGTYSNDGEVSGLQGDADGWFVKFDVGTWVEEMDEAHGFIVYPNPSASYIEVDLYGIDQPAFLNVTNSLGQPFYDGTPAERNVRIDVSSWPPGMYFLQVLNEANNRIYSKAFEVMTAR